jgi:folate-binding protein YgfZ
MPSADASYDEMRLALGVPEFGKDFIGEEVFLLDVNYDALGAVNYRKGCFVGQEVTSRMKRKGEIRKRTLIARFDGDPPPAGAAVTAGDLDVAEIQSGGPGIALALARLDRLKAAEAAGAAPAADGRKLLMTFPDYLERV